MDLIKWKLFQVELSPRSLLHLFGNDLSIFTLLLQLAYNIEIALLVTVLAQLEDMIDILDLDLESDDLLHQAMHQVLGKIVENGS